MSIDPRGGEQAETDAASAVVPRALDGLVRQLIAPLLAAEVASPWRVLGWDAEQGIGLSLGRGEDVLLFELGRADPDRPCYARTRRFNVCVRRAFDARSTLGAAEREVVERVVELLREREGLLPEIERVPTGRRSLVREIAVEQLLVAEGRSQYYLNPYVGCTIGCEFCYVAELADFSRSLEGLPRLSWGRYLDVKVNAPSVLAEEVRRLPPGIVRLSPILTDPYQPAERRYRLTRRCLEILLEAGFGAVILTRAERVTADLDLLRRFPATAVGLSIPTDDDRIRAAFEPGADPIESRIEALAACREAGVRAFVVVQPMLPMSPEQLVERVAPYVCAARIDRMHQLGRVRGLYQQARQLDATSDEFFSRTEARLRAGMARHGIAIDELDDLAGLLARGTGGSAP
jgi:DNA repair photolyase